MLPVSQLHVYNGIYKVLAFSVNKVINTKLFQAARTDRRRNIIPAWTLLSIPTYPVKQPSWSLVGLSLYTVLVYLPFACVFSLDGK